MSSAAGRLGMAGRSAYSASKWAVIGLTKSLAIELGPTGIRVNAICPGAVNGPRIDAVIEAKADMLGRPVDEVSALYHNQSSLGRLIEAEDIANMAVFAVQRPGPQRQRPGPRRRRQHRKTLLIHHDTRGDHPMALHAKSSSPAPSPAPSTPRPCPRTCPSPRTKSPTPRSAPPRPAPRSCTCTPATPRTAGPRRTRSTSNRSWTSSSATPTPSSTSPPAARRT